MIMASPSVSGTARLAQQVFARGRSPAWRRHRSAAHHLFQVFNLHRLASSPNVDHDPVGCAGSILTVFQRTGDRDVKDSVALADDPRIPRGNKARAERG